MTLHLGLSSHLHQRNAQQQQEIREARRLLRERVRNDWNYLPLPAYRSHRQPAAAPSLSEADSVEEAEKKVAGFRFHHSPAVTVDGVANSNTPNSSPAAVISEPLEWREREYSSESGDEEDVAKRYHRQQQEAQTWRFEGPDSVGSELLDRRIAWKRRKQQAMNEEGAWNDGLAHWARQRDLWTGAQTSAQIQERDRARASAFSAENSASASGSAGSTPRTSMSTVTSASASSAAEAGQTAPTPVTTPELEPTSSQSDTEKGSESAEHQSTSSSSSSSSSQEASNLSILIPVAPPILINHPIRRRITPSIYPEIYSKIIAQSRTPSVPINLQTLIRALVQGWKDEGEWPPKPGVLERPIGRKRGKDGDSALKSSVKAVGRVLRITSADPAVVAGQK